MEDTGLRFTLEAELFPETSRSIVMSKSWALNKSSAASVALGNSKQSLLAAPQPQLPPVLYRIYSFLAPFGQPCVPLPCDLKYLSLNVDIDQHDFQSQNKPAPPCWRTAAETVQGVLSELALDRRKDQCWEGSYYFLPTIKLYTVQCVHGWRRLLKSQESTLSWVCLGFLCVLPVWSWS